MKWKIQAEGFWLMVSLMAVMMLVAGCASPESTPSAADIQTAIAETLTAAPTITNTPTPEIEATPEPSPTDQRPSPTPVPNRPVDAIVDVAFLNMRSGPSTFFEVIETFEEGTNVLAKFRTDDGSWVQVEIETENRRE